MIKNFERETCPLTDYEKDELVPLVVQVLQHCKGKKYALSNKNFINRWGSGYKLNPARFRKVVNYIRNKGMIKGLIATSKGYYIAQSRQELEDYIKSLQGRENAVKELRKNITKQMNKLYNKKE
jgi:hypothetical protein